MTLRMWRERLTYVVVSVFVAWHTLAIVVGPAPDSLLTESFRALFQPYLTLLRLDNKWDFFAPVVGEGSRFRYVIEDKDGKNHTFAPTEGLSWFHPNYFWFRSWYYAIMDDPDVQGDPAAAKFCRRHASLQPVSVTLLEIQEETYTRADFLSGKRRMDPEFYTVKTLKRAQCSAK